MTIPKTDAENAYWNAIEDMERVAHGLHRGLDDMLWQIEQEDGKEPQWLRAAIRRLRLITLLCQDGDI